MCIVELSAGHGVNSVRCMDSSLDKKIQFHCFVVTINVKWKYVCADDTMESHVIRMA